MQTILTNIISQNNIIMNIPIPLLLNRDTILDYNCIGCNKQTTKSFCAFCKNHLCRTCIINNKPIPYEKSLLYLNPKVASFWHPIKNTKGPKDYKCFSMKKVWWLCNIKEVCGCLHEFEANICDMVKCNSSNSKGCPFCTNMGAHKKFCIHKSLGKLFPDICKYWSKNNLNTPYTYSPHSEEEVLWNCNGCSFCGIIHEYTQKISSKTGKKSNGEIRGNNSLGGCIVCQVGTQKICDCQKLEIKYPHLYKECDIEKNKEENENFDINIIPLSSSINLWWKCETNLQHKWDARLSNRTNNDSGCPYCYAINHSLIQTKPLDQLIKEIINIHDNQYDYPFIETEYINSYSFITILHKNCGKTHKVNVGHHKNRMVGCQYCNKGRKYSKMAINYLNFISKLNKINIIHAENEGEFSIPTTRYKADGYCKETNTIYEFHGTIYHGHPILNYNLQDCNYLGKKYSELYQKTLEREQQIKDLGYNLIIMWEHNWNNINKSIKKLQRKFRSNR